MDTITRNNIVKYQVVIHDDQFSFEENSITIVLSWGLMGESVTITKDNLLHDESGNYYFFVNTAGMYGTVVATCQFGVEDADSDGSEWPMTDRRHIFKVVDMSCCADPCVCECATEDGALVTYVQYTAVAGEHTVLMDSQGNVISDVNGYMLEVNS